MGAISTEGGRQDPTHTRLREISDDEFTGRYNCDRFTAAVILNRLRYAVEHMSAGFLHEAFSPIIRD